MDSENHMFEPDVVLASELHEPSRSRLPDPERSLMIAVLEEASRCFLNYCTAADRRQQELYAEARDWFASADQRYLFAYENVCHVLGIDPDYLRRRIFAVRDRRRAAGVPTHRSVRTDAPESALPAARAART